MIGEKKTVKFFVRKERNNKNEKRKKKNEQNKNISVWQVHERGEQMRMSDLVIHMDRRYATHKSKHTDTE